MSSSDAVEDIFEEVDTNRDGVIDKKELRNWASKGEGVTSSSYESSTYGHDLKDNTASRFNRYTYEETTAATGTLTNETVINTSSSEETKRYLERSGANIYVDLNPQIIRRATTERPLTLEQRVRIRCLQPPPLPPPEPLIVREVREQLPPLPPLVIREQTSYTTPAPPLILRERPPIPPARVPGETVTRYLPAMPAQPRSLVIERIPPGPEKPRDIIIERWLPYGPQPERRTIVQPAPAISSIKYTAPSHTVIIYDAAQSNVVRRFERLGVTEEDPDAYAARYAGSLLDPTTLVHEARRAGVTEDISCPVLLSTISVTTRGHLVDHDHSSNVINQGFALSASHFVGDSGSAGSVREVRSGYHVGDVGLTATNTQRDRELNQTEYHQYY